jgi:serine protease Do
MLWVRAAIAAGLLTFAGSTGFVLPRAEAQQGSPSGISTGSYLGVWVWDLDAAQAKELRVGEGSGVVVTLVSPGSPAEQAGIHPGDVISDFNGQKVEDKEQFSRLVRDTAPGRLVKLKIVRNGAAHAINAKIGSISSADRPGPIAIPQGSARNATFPQPDVPRSLTTWRSPVLGVDAEPLFGQLASYFGVSEGVLVRSVAAGSPAEKAGIKAGDVITHVGKQPVTTPAAITAQLRAQPSATVKLGVTRERSAISISVTLE